MDICVGDTLRLCHGTPFYTGLDFAPTNFMPEGTEITVNAIDDDLVKTTVTKGNDYWKEGTKFCARTFTIERNFASV